MSPMLALLPVPLVLAVLAVLRPGLLTSGAGSPIALLTGLGVAAAGFVVLAALWRRSRSLALWTADVVVLALLGLVLWPAVRERTVVEAFPPVEPAVAAADVTPLPTAVPTEGRTEVPTETPTSLPAASAPPRPSGPEAVARGALHGIGHRASGRVVVYRLDGRLVVRFEDISFQGTPTPVVHLVSAGRRSPSGGVRLGALKGEHGSFGYPVPAGAPLVRVLVWCQRYDVPIASADLAAVR